MKTIVIAAFLSFFSLFLPSYGYANDASSVPAITFKPDKLTIKTSRENHHFTIDIAETPEQQLRGLMYRTDLPEDYGMLFILKDDREMSMWMRNTPSSLDMLFIDAHGRIVKIAAETTPNSDTIISSGEPVHAVLELPGGTAAKRYIKVGNRVVHSSFIP